MSEAHTWVKEVTTPIPSVNILSDYTEMSDAQTKYKMVSPPMQIYRYISDYNK